MADILIRGMEMPSAEQGLRTINIYADGVVTNYAEEVIATAIALPEGHGRLVDADALEKTVGEAVYQYWNSNGGGYYLAEDAIPDIRFAPTIVPAEKENMEGSGK